MENNYQYLDPEEKYTNSKGVLHNLANIKDERILVAFESFKVTKRLEELYAQTFKIKDSLLYLTCINIYFKMYMIGQVK